MLCDVQAVVQSVRDARSEMRDSRRPVVDEILEKTSLLALKSLHLSLIKQRGDYLDALTKHEQNRMVQPESCYSCLSPGWMD